MEFVSNDCDTFFEFAYCTAVILKSTRDKQLVVAFKGTKGPVQLVEQVLKVFLKMKSFAPTGGKVSQSLIELVSK